MLLPIPPRAELDNLPLDDIKILCRHYHVHIKSTTRKEDLVDVLSSLSNNDTKTAPQSVAPVPAPNPALSAGEAAAVSTAALLERIHALQSRLSDISARLSALPAKLAKKEPEEEPVHEGRPRTGRASARKRRL